MSMYTFGKIASETDLISKLVVGFSTFGQDKGVNFNYNTVDVKTTSGTATIKNIGTLLKYRSASSAFVPLTVPADWAAATAYVVGDVVKPATRNGFEYVAVVAGTSGGTEPAFPTVSGGNIVDNTVTWVARTAYTVDMASPLPNKAAIAIAVGAGEGYGFNVVDSSISTSASKITALFRGHAAIYKEGIVFGSIAVADQAEIITALELAGINVITQADVVTPTVYNP